MQGTFIENLGLSFVKTCLMTYWGNICYFGVYLICLIYLYAKYKKETEMFSVYTVFLFATIYNPVLVKYIFRYFNMDDVYYRFFWLLPVTYIMAFTSTKIVKCEQHVIRKIIFGIGIIYVLVFTGIPVKSIQDICRIPDNLYCVSNDVIEISKYIHKDTERKNIHLAVSNDLVMTIRQYDASLLLTLNRDFVLCWEGAENFQSLADSEVYPQQKAIMDVIYAGNTTNPEGFLEAIQETYTNYLVVSKSIDIDIFLRSNRFENIGETENYRIYKCLFT
ncbi:hypothetical protein DW177_12210 [Blautia sp. AM16-16B]|nr:hypothetical protein DW177_12210 [Blautia sp. AM16-16B]